MPETWRPPQGKELVSKFPETVFSDETRDFVSKILKKTSWFHHWNQRWACQRLPSEYWCHWIDIFVFFQMYFLWLTENFTSRKFIETKTKNYWSFKTYEKRFIFTVTFWMMVACCSFIFPLITDLDILIIGSNSQWEIKPNFEKKALPNPKVIFVFNLDFIVVISIEWLKFTRLSIVYLGSSTPRFCGNLS